MSSHHSNTTQKDLGMVNQIDRMECDNPNINRSGYLIQVFFDKEVVVGCGSCGGVLQYANTGILIVILPIIPILLRL